MILPLYVRSILTHNTNTQARQHSFYRIIY